jgi:trypsin
VAIKALSVIRHDTFLLTSSIALIYTATVMTLNANVQTIALNANMIGGNVSAQVSGWGSTLLTGGLSPNNLQRMATTTISTVECRSRHRPENAQRIGDSNLCALTRSGEGTCFGDEGGALIAGGNLIGVLSWQVPCGTGVPDVYEQVAAYRLWIMSVAS